MWVCCSCVWIMCFLCSQFRWRDYYTWFSTVSWEEVVITVHSAETSGMIESLSSSWFLWSECETSWGCNFIKTLEGRPVLSANSPKCLQLIQIQLCRSAEVRGHPFKFGSHPPPRSPAFPSPFIWFIISGHIWPLTSPSGSVEWCYLNLCFSLPLFVVTTHRHVGNAVWGLDLTSDLTFTFHICLSFKLTPNWKCQENDTLQDNII